MTAITAVWRIVTNANNRKNNKILYYEKRLQIMVHHDVAVSAVGGNSNPYFWY